jgi:hypothetical protein
MTDHVPEYLRLARAQAGPGVGDMSREDWWVNHARELRELWASLEEPVRARGITARRFGTALAMLGRLAESDLQAPWVVGDFNDAYLGSLGVAEPEPTVRGLI